MFEEGQLYSPVTTDTSGDAVVHLSEDHPGATDQVYRERRNRIATLASAWQPGEPLPAADYTAEEQEVWRVVCGELHALHERLACAEYLDGKAKLGLPEDHIPQLTEVNERLTPLTGFRYVPAAGLVPLLQFYGSLADGVFHSTQYVRHHSVPLYTPEPDVIHELIGHVNGLASPRIARLCEAAGRASLAATTDEALDRFSRVFWYTIEFGVVREHDRWRTYGAGLLSSFGEIQAFDTVDIRPFDIEAMIETHYDITRFQDVLFAADSFDDAERAVLAYFESA